MRGRTDGADLACYDSPCAGDGAAAVRVFGGCGDRKRRAVFAGGCAMSDDSGAAKSHPVCPAEHRQQDPARYFQRNRTDREISVCGFSDTEFSIYGGNLLRAGDLGFYGSGTFVGVLGKSEGACGKE